MDLYTMDLKDFANEDGLPIMDSIQFKRWTEKLGKERFREVLSEYIACLLYTSPSPRDVEESRMPSSA